MAPEQMALGPEVGNVAAQCGMLKHFRAHQAIYCGGDTTVGVLRQGLLTTVMEFPGGRRSLVGLYAPGDLLCDWVDSSAMVSLVVQTPAELRLMKVEDLRSACGASLDCGQALLQAQRRGAGRVRLHAARLARFTGEERLASFLVEIGVRIGRRLIDRIDVQLPLGRDDIADYLGLNADTVSRLLSRLKRDGLIEFDGRSVLHILEWSRLVALSPIGPSAWCAASSAPGSFAR
jgi:CRP-like cAMP-binding protein